MEIIKTCGLCTHYNDGSDGEQIGCGHPDGPLNPFRRCGNKTCERFDMNYELCNS